MAAGFDGKAGPGDFFSKKLVFDSSLCLGAWDLSNKSMVFKAAETMGGARELEKR